MLEAAKKIDSLLEAKIIRRVTNPWVLSIHIVKKSNLVNIAGLYIFVL